MVRRLVHPNLMLLPLLISDSQWVFTFQRVEENSCQTTAINRDKIFERLGTLQEAFYVWIGLVEDRGYVR